jgi:hypothetical protein
MDSSTGDDSGGSSGGGVEAGSGMYDFVYVANGNGAEHQGFTFYAVVIDVTTSTTGTLVGPVQGMVDHGRWVSFTWHKILQDNHKYIMAMYAPAMGGGPCVTGAITNGMTGGGGGQFIFPVPAPGTIAVGTGFPKAGAAPATNGIGGGTSTGVITADIVKASEMGTMKTDGSYYMYRFSSNPAPTREPSCMYFPNAMGTTQLQPPCDAPGNTCVK